MQIEVHGAGLEVGRSCFVVDGKIMFDCGLMIVEEGVERPLLKKAEQIECAFISHGHLDHLGALPYFNDQGLDCPIFTRGISRDIARILMKDSLHIEMLSKREPSYGRDNIRNVLGLMENVAYNKWRSVEGLSSPLRFQFLPAGHIPGSSTIIVDYKGKRIVYSGDYNSTNTHLLKGEAQHIEDVDILFTESTYGSRDHDAREKEEKRFLTQVKKTLNNGGNVLIPTFAVGRAQEIALLLEKIDARIYMDGMAKQISNIILRNPGEVRDIDRLRRAMKRIIYIKNMKSRHAAISKGGVYLTTSGMLDGGPVLEYMKYMYHDSRNSVLLTGYQAEGSNGRMLLDEGKVFIDGHFFKVNAFHDRYDFSAHAGRKEILDYVKRMNPKTVILEHGDEDAIMALKDALKEYDVRTPKTGERVTV